MLGILWFLLWQLVGFSAVNQRLYDQTLCRRLWLGSCIGSMLSAWCPVVFSFLFGFSIKSHFAALVVAALLLLLSLKNTDKDKSLFVQPIRSEFFLVGAFFAFSLFLLLNHTLTEGTDGLYTGQCTYGDMSMHLGFITSIAEQGTFPPEYSILPGTKLCYPFLCDSISSSLYLLGTGLRAAYIIPSAFALLQVFTGFWYFSFELTQHRGIAALAFLFFFLNGGFGLVYFLNGTHTFRELLTGFYITPTNLTPLGIRWVNVIADMLIPQRATLFGWSLLFPALFLLYRAIRHDEIRYALPAGIIGGCLPMIHTHSFFALGLCAMCWMLYSFIKSRDLKQWLSVWCIFGFTAVFLALPQLFIWTFRTVNGNSQFLRFNLDWVNGFEENWLIFWVKNVGIVFLITPFAFLYYLRKKDIELWYYTPIVFIFVLCELVLFQPNPYDNNKLLYIAYAFACILSSKLVVAFLKDRKVIVKAAALILVLVLSTNAAVFTLAREAISGCEGYAYQLFTTADLEAAEFIKKNTPPDSVFLTANNHNNTVAVLTGRSIVCGSPSYVYYHGLDYTQAQTDELAMLSDGNKFLTKHEAYNISYVFIGRNEKWKAADEAYFTANYPIIFQNSEITIYQVN